MNYSNPHTMSIMVSHRDSDKRQSGRLPVDGIEGMHRSKKFGDVINLSPTGLLIMRTKRIHHEEHDRFIVQLKGNDLEIEVYVKIEWEKRIGFRKWLYGLSYSALTERDLMIVKRMAMLANVKNTSRQDQLKSAG